MKKIILALALTFSGFAPELSLAKLPEAPTDIAIQNLPIEVSVLLLHPNYQRILSEQSQLAAQERKSLRISSFYVQHIGAQAFVYAHLSVSDSALPPQGEMQWHELGAIVGSVVYGPRGEVTLSAVYLEPTATPPGGASVGNN